MEFQVKYHRRLRTSKVIPSLNLTPKSKKIDEFDDYKKNTMQNPCQLHVLFNNKWCVVIFGVCDKNYSKSLSTM